ncbi:MAG: polymer-forming cytoskeletal protein [Proteobacteria bacterium]|nr:polymer-forming cytoskeletal protein [Pseudomonadota bacterium]
MFSKASREIAVAPSKASAPSIISADLRITGNLESDGDIQIDGSVDGDIRSGRVTISESAVVKGAVEAETVRIAGRLTGQVKARQVTLMTSARVVADVMQESLAIEPGASFEGNCRHFSRGEGATTGAQRKIEQLMPAALARKAGEVGKVVVAPTNGAGHKASEGDSRI